MVLSSTPANKEIYNEISIIMVLIIAVKTEAGESKVQVEGVEGDLKVQVEGEADETKVQIEEVETVESEVEVDKYHEKSKVQVE